MRFPQWGITTYSLFNPHFGLNNYLIIHFTWGGFLINYWSTMFYPIVTLRRTCNHSGSSHVTRFGKVWTPSPPFFQRYLEDLKCDFLTFLINFRNDYLLILDLFGFHKQLTNLSQGIFFLIIYSCKLQWNPSMHTKLQ